MKPNTRSADRDFFFLISVWLEKESEASVNNKDIYLVTFYFNLSQSISVVIQI